MGTLTSYVSTIVGIGVDSVSLIVGERTTIPLTLKNTVGVCTNLSGHVAEEWLRLVSCLLITEKITPDHKRQTPCHAMVFVSSAGKPVIPMPISFSPVALMSTRCPVIC